MSVIGRLDDQVEAVLINPLKPRERPQDAGRERDAPHTTPPAPAHTEREAESSEEPREVAASLPVWLL